MAKAATSSALSVEELQARSKKLTEEIDKLGKMPPRSKELRYRTPVSAEVQTEEMMFECRGGKVSLIDHGTMLAEIQRQVRSKEKELRTSWEVTDVTAPVGAFRLRYTVERERSVLDVPGAAPTDGPFRYGVTRWEVVPIRSERGETLEQALASDSEFRKIIDSAEPQQTAVTFWVYPDSFALFRRLRDYLYEKDFVVAGRPLPDGRTGRQFPSRHRQPRSVTRRRPCAPNRPRDSRSLLQRRSVIVTYLLHRLACQERCR